MAIQGFHHITIQEKINIIPIKINVVPFSLISKPLPRSEFDNKAYNYILQV